MTRGLKSSERKACYEAFYANLALVAVFAVCKLDMNILVGLLPVVNLPLMWLAGMRTVNKWKNGEKE